jgi:hypothetical protein
MIDPTTAPWDIVSGVDGEQRRMRVGAERWSQTERDVSIHTEFAVG